MMRGWIVGLVAAMLVAIAVATMAALLLRPGDDTIVLDLEVGDCFDVPDDIANATIATVDAISCTDPHEAEVFATGELDPDRDQPYPDDEQQLFARVDARCAAVLADHPDVVQRFGVLPVVADEKPWSSFRGGYVCVAIPYGGGTTDGSLGL
jgi:hypothetical protein